MVQFDYKGASVGVAVNRYGVIYLSTIDVCKILGHEVMKIIPRKEHSTHDGDSVISTTGVYALIKAKPSPEALCFKEWTVSLVAHLGAKYQAAKARLSVLPQLEQQYKELSKVNVSIQDAMDRLNVVIQSIKWATEWIEEQVIGTSKYTEVQIVTFERK